MDSRLEEYTGFCPLCNNIFKFTTSFFCTINDIDSVLLKCIKCGDTFGVLRVKNHETFSSICGVDIVGAIDKIEENDSSIVICSDLVCTDDDSLGIFQDSIFAYMMKGRIKNPFVEDSRYPLYQCECGDNLECITMDTILKSRDYKKIIHDICNFYHARRWHGLDFLVFQVPIKCSCKIEYTSIAFTHAFLYGEYPKPEHFLIAGIRGCTSHNINGVYSKDVCRSFVRKFAVRWSLISSHKYIVSAFIGSQYLKTEEANGLWNDLAMTFSPNNNTTLTTKSRTNNEFQKKIEESKTLSTMRKYGMLEHGKMNVMRCEKTHTKFYAALTPLGVEVISGSFNYSNGPSTDNLCYSMLTKEKFDNNYLRNINEQLIRVAS